MAPHRPRVATRRLTKEELTRLGFSPGSKRHVAADIKRVTKRTRTWSERQAIQARKGMTKEAYTKGIQRGEFAYSEKTAKHQRHVEYGRRINKHVPEMTAKDRRFMFEARDTYLDGARIAHKQALRRSAIDPGKDRDGRGRIWAVGRTGGSDRRRDDRRDGRARIGRDRASLRGNLIV